MNGTWIPLYGTVFTDPKVTIAARRLTRDDVPKMVGHLAHLWTWAADNAETGDLSHMRARAIATAAGWRGDEHKFVKVLLDVGLFDAGPTIHEFERYAGRLVARRRSDRERKDAARKAEKDAEAAKLSAGTPAVDDSDRTATAIDVDVDAFQAVRGTGVWVADGPRSSGGIGRSGETVGANVERALDVLRRIRWYPLSEILDRPLLQATAFRAPGQDLAADVTRWATTARGTVKRPRASLTAWLQKFGDQDRPIDPSTHPLAAGERAAQERWESERTPEALAHLRKTRGIA